MNEVKLVKLVNGEDILAKVTTIDNGQKVVVTNPAMVIMSPQGVRLLPWPMLGNQKQFELSSNHVLITSSIPDEVLNAYNQDFGSGLVLAKGSLNV